MRHRRLYLRPPRPCRASHDVGRVVELAKRASCDDFFAAVCAFCTTSSYKKRGPLFVPSSASSKPKIFRMEGADRVVRWHKIKGEVMRRYSLALLAAAAVVPTAGQFASAADLARRPPPAPAYVPPAPLPYLWTGCYVGGNVGGAWSNFEITDVATGGTVSDQ